MKTSFLFAVLVAVIITGNIAATETSIAASENYVAFQPPQGQRPTPEARAKRETEWMKTDLALTDKQIVLVDSVNLKYAQRQDELMRNGKDQDREALHQKMEELQKQKVEELKTVLSEDQMKKYAELLPQHRGRGKGGPRPDGTKTPNNN